jgi:8-oxo-dGTP diphosphatase
MLSELKYCPRCAGDLEWHLLTDQVESHPVCTKCGFILWQNPKPCVDALIIRRIGTEVEVLLGRRSSQPALGLWDLPGGFLNVGDRVEQALMRECSRELGIQVHLLDILGAYEDQFLETSIITLVFVCEIIAGQPQAVDTIDKVEWFPLLDPPPLAFPSVARAIADLQHKFKL